MSAPPDVGAGGMPGFDMFTLRATLGPLLIGGLMSTVLYGITCAQTFVFYQNSLADRWPLKLTVLILWIIDTFDVVLNGHILYHYLVVNFLNPLALTVPVWSILLHVTVTALSNCIVRGAFTLRVWRMSNKNWFLCTFITLVSFVELACSIAITTKAFGTTFLGLQALSPLFYADFAAVLAADLTVALSLCFFLHVSRTGIRNTESLINVLIMYTINTGLLTAADSSAGLITFVVMPDNFVYIAFYLQLSKLYVNAYLATLNARENLRDRSQVNEHVSINLSKLSHTQGTHSAPFMTASSQESTAVDKSGGLSIRVTTHVDEMMDEDLKSQTQWNGSQNA